MLKVSDLNYRTQNDFGLATASTDNLGSPAQAANSWRLLFLQSWNISLRFPIYILRLLSAFLQEFTSNFACRAR